MHQGASEETEEIEEFKSLIFDSVPTLTPWSFPTLPPERTMSPKSAAGPLGMALLLALATDASSAVKPHALFTDGVVLQRDAKVPVWGTADEGEKVTVSFAGQEVSATAKDGRWRVELAPLKVGEPSTLTIKGTNTVEVADVLVGDVWVCGGQSNMEWPMHATDAPESAIAAADDAKLRLFSVPRRGEGKPQSDVQGAWTKASPEAVKGFTAVGYYFGRDLRKALDVPIGLISSNVGGTEAEALDEPQDAGGRSEAQGPRGTRQCLGPL